MDVRRTGILVLVLAGCGHGPEDGVLAIDFLLQPPPPSDARILPPASELGAEPFVLGAALGTCRLNVPGQAAECRFEALPPLAAPASGSRAYEAAFLIGDHAIGARFNGADIDQPMGIPNPDFPLPEAPPPKPRAALGAVSPDPLGAAVLRLEGTNLPLHRVVGGEVHLVVTKPGAEPSRYLVLDGRVGNFPDDQATEPTPAPSGGGGHTH